VGKRRDFWRLVTSKGSRKLKTPGSTRPRCAAKTNQVTTSDKLKRIMMYKSPIIKQYRRYRKAGTALHHKIIDKYVDDEVIGEAAKALGLGENRVLV
jgi:hypothetical protein